ncbi:hypothetical protein [Pseudoalteromonas rubra]|uniref:hypothetical protein n=1 Tax=Pseudoalteromonas rubra TaxID=43658 RepID=UPI000F79DF48|nr:hypothetical protein [Pseudoalteromonas rubra]
MKLNFKKKADKNLTHTANQMPQHATHQVAGGDFPQLTNNHCSALDMCVTADCFTLDCSAPL